MARTPRPPRPPAAALAGAVVLLVLAAPAPAAEAARPCPAAGARIHWVADYCMLKMETDDEIAVSDCIEEESRARFPGACAGNVHFKRRMCELTIRNGVRVGTVERCVNDPAFRGRTVEHGGVGG